jgi:hypothetical protein
MRPGSGALVGNWRLSCARLFPLPRAHARPGRSCDLPGMPKISATSLTSYRSRTYAHSRARFLPAPALPCVTAQQRAYWLRQGDPDFPSLRAKLRDRGAHRRSRRALRVSVNRVYTDGRVKLHGISRACMAATSTCTTGERSIGSPLYGPQASPTELPTPCGTHSRPSASRLVCRSLSLPASWVRAPLWMPSALFPRLMGTIWARGADHALTCPNEKPRDMRGFLVIGAPGFEPGTSCPPDKRANQAAPRPVGGQD